MDVKSTVNHIGSLQATKAGELAPDHIHNIKYSLLNS